MSSENSVPQVKDIQSQAPLRTTNTKMCKKCGIKRGQQSCFHYNSYKTKDLNEWKMIDR